jgi:hypothetical protein
VLYCFVVFVGFYSSGVYSATVFTRLSPALLVLITLCAASATVVVVCWF